MQRLPEMFWDWSEEVLWKSPSELGLKALNHGRFYLHQENPISFVQESQDGKPKIFVVKRNVANNSQTICDDAKFEDVTKMTIDV